MTNPAKCVYTMAMAQTETQTAHRLFIIPTVDVGPALMAAAVADYITETEEASEDVTVETIAGIVSVSADWADAEWCELLAAAVEDARPGTHAWIAHRKEQA